MHPVECPNCPGGERDGVPCSVPKTFDQAMAGAQDTIYLCNFRVSVDGEWLCLKELDDYEFGDGEVDVDGGSGSPQLSLPASPDDPPPMFMGMLSKDLPLVLSQPIFMKVLTLVVIPGVNVFNP